MNVPGFTRRSFLGATIGGTVTAIIPRSTYSVESNKPGFPCLPNDGTVRDKFWIWGGAPDATNDDWGHAGGLIRSVRSG